jgi:hypothetical protein
MKVIENCRVKASFIPILLTKKGVKGAESLASGDG